MFSFFYMEEDLNFNSDITKSKLLSSIDRIIFFRFGGSRVMMPFLFGLNIVVISKGSRAINHLDNCIWDFDLPIFYFTNLARFIFHCHDRGDTCLHSY